MTILDTEKLQIFAALGSSFNSTSNYLKTAFNGTVKTPFFPFSVSSRFLMPCKSRKLGLKTFVFIKLQIMIESLLPLVSAAIGAVIPYFKKGGEAIAGEATKDLYSWVKDKLTAKNKETALEDLKNSPDDPKIQGRLEAILENVIAENNDLVEELKRFVSAATAENAKQGNTISVRDSEKFVAGSVSVNKGHVHVGDNYGENAGGQGHKQ